MKKAMGVSAMMLAAVAGQAMAQVVVDGVRSGSEPYQQVWVQNQPTSFGDNLAGAIGTGRSGRDVTTGIEVGIPLASLGLTSGFPAGGIRLTGILGNGANLGNQVIGADPLPTNSAGLGQGNNVNFSTIAGNQFLVLNPQVDTTGPVLDGVLDGNQPLGAGGYWAGKQVWFNTNYTNQGDNTLGQVGSANGSELDNLFASISTNGTVDPADDVLWLFIGGNFHDFRRLGLYIDALAGGQNRILNGNQGWGFGYLEGIRASNPTATNGLTFDAGFEPEQLFIINAGNNGPMFMDSYLLPTVPPGSNQGTYMGNVQPGNTTGAFAEGSLGVANGATVVLSYNNTNILGVEGAPAGTSSIPSRDLATGSELNNLWGFVDDQGTPSTSDDVLHLHIAGNLETNFNKLSLFFDVDSVEGQNQLRGDADLPKNPDADFNGLNRMGNGGNGAVGAGTGLKFDTGFTADYWLAYGGGGAPVEHFSNAAVLRTSGRFEASGFQTEYSSFEGGLKSNFEPLVFGATYAECQAFEAVTDIPNTNGGPRITSADNATAILVCDPNNTGQATSPVLTPGLITITLDNNNIGGVRGIDNGDVSGAASVATGFEVRVSLRELGWDGTSPIKVAGLITNSGYDFASNQVIGGIGGGPVLADLGEVTQVDFSQLPGDQFVIIPLGGGVPGCDSVDFNNDGVFPDDQDLADFIFVLGGGFCPTCNDVDFNNDDVFPDDSDLETFLFVLGGGNC